MLTVEDSSKLVISLQKCKSLIHSKLQIFKEILKMQKGNIMVSVF